MLPLRQLSTIASVFLLLSSINAQTEIFWRGGSGDWDNVNMWFKDSLGVNAAGVIPGPDYIARFTQSSLLTSNSNVRIQPGSHEVHSIIVTASSNFRIYLNGSASNEADMNVYGDLSLLSSHRLEYASTNISHNVWKFQGSNVHDIQSGGLDLMHVEFFDSGGVFNQKDDWTVSEQIRMYAGTWNSNSHDINGGRILFEDTGGSSNTESKVFNSGSSDITIEEWESGFTYGSLVVTGNHTIRTQKFRGSPYSGNTNFEFHEIHLLEYSDSPTSGTILEHNNFECKRCTIESIVVEDTGDTKFADAFTVTGKFTVVNQGSSILFNSGNGRENEITLNGTIITPKVVDCFDPRTIFSTVHTDLTIFKRANGTLTVSDALVNNIQTETSGGATFNLSGGVLQGSSTGWNLINDPPPVDFYWKGIAGGNGNWENPINWVDASGIVIGCIPTIFDDVYIVEASKGNIRIPSPFNAVCRNFNWTNKDGFTLLLDGTINSESALTVSGNFDLHVSAIITPVERHKIYFSSATNNYIKTGTVILPEIWFLGDLGEWSLQDDLICDKLTFEAGTLNTQNQDIDADSWYSVEDNPKLFNFGSSHIKVNGEMSLAPDTSNHVTVSQGTSLIECDNLISAVTVLYDVQLNNTSNRLMGNFPYNFNSFILNGTGQVSTRNDMTLNDLIFQVDGSTLAADITDPLVINGGIESMASVGNPAKLKSRVVGIQSDIDKPVGNICALGYVEFTDINAVLSGVFNAPDGINIGNNTGINYDDGALSDALYWIGGSGAWEIQSNWSKVSGGCPSSANPNNTANLVFNNFGFYNNNETITVPTANNCGKMYFYNSAKSVTLDMTFTLSPLSLVVVNGDVSMTGKHLFVLGETRIESGGFLSTDMTHYTTETLDTSSGLLVVRNGSKVTIAE